jgi:hypothetical protein
MLSSYIKDSSNSDYSTGIYDKIDNPKKETKNISEDVNISQQINDNNQNQSKEMKNFNINTNINLTDTNNNTNISINDINNNTKTYINDIDNKTDKNNLEEPKEKITNKTENNNNNNKIDIKDINNIIKYNIDNLIYIICLFCNRNIVTKLISKTQILLLNQQNIQCKNCKGINYISICPKCKNIQQIKRFVSEGESIKCSNNLCNFPYLQALCPIKLCFEMFYFPLNKNFCNSPNGLIHVHKANEIVQSEQIVFQKISCYFCLRPIIYLSTQSNRNVYYEGMKVICPYNDCGKCFNRIICSNPRCNNIIYMEMGLFKMGQRIKCNKCSTIFSKLLCISCFRTMPLEKNIFKYGQLECRYNSCSKINHYANCVHCNQLNYFQNLDKPLIQGQSIQCGNKSCKKIFNIVYCPGCHELNPFPNGDFVFGRPYKCKYTAICSKTFLILICPNCWNYSRMVEDVEGKKYTCNKCNKLLANFQCPHCNICILDKNSFFNFGQMIKCPMCNKLFTFFRCYDCKKLIYSKEEILGKKIECQHCHKNSVNIICTKCKSKITFSKKETDMTFGEEISCPSCQQKFNFGDRLGDEFEKIYEKDLTYIKTLTGSTINYGIPQVDENYMERRENIFSEDKMERIIEKNDQCIICQSNKKESIFFPCGHRCTCYKCAVVYFEVHKMCPKCNEKAQAVIPKIFNS